MTLLEALRGSIAALKSGGNDNPRFEAEQLVLKECSVSRTELIISPEREISAEQQSRLEELIKRRLSGEPLQYLLGEWEFYGFPFEVGEGVLIPRQDTEAIVELAARYIGKETLVADLCAGSGCIGISLARLKGCRVNCFELSPQALGFLTRNIALNGVEEQVKAVQADVLSEEIVSNSPLYGAIVTNPPYLTAEDMQSLQTEVSFEPKMALYGGADGLDFYRRIIPLWLTRLENGGFFAAEIGIHQEQAVGEILRGCGIEPRCYNDACGVCRVVWGIKVNQQ